MKSRFYTLLAAFAATSMLSLTHAELKYVFYFIGDGMGMGHVNAAQYYNRMVLGSTEPLLMMQFPVASQAMTYSASAPVTDSAAAGTALASGIKTKNSMVGIAPDSVTQCLSLASRLHDAGWGVGVLTTCAPDDATPAAFYAHQVNRTMYERIDSDATCSPLAFLGGASLRGLVNAKGEPTQVNKLIDDGGITVTYGAEQAMEKAGKVKRLWTLASPEARSGSNDIGLTIDSIPGAMTLAQLTKVAMKHMNAVSPKRFFLMVEGGSIDHCAHSNDPGGVVKEILAFQDAIAEAYKFYLAHPKETLIVVTADHDTGGMAIGHPLHYGHCDLSLLDSQRISKDAFTAMCRQWLAPGAEAITWDMMKQILTDKLGFWSAVPVNSMQTQRIESAFNRTFVERNSADQRGLYNTFNEFIVEVFNTYNFWVGTHFISGDHTANPVPVYAIGQGSERFGHLLNNIDIPTTIFSLTNK